MTQYKLSFLHRKKPVTRDRPSYAGTIKSTVYISKNYKTKNPSIYSYIVFVFKDSKGSVIDVSGDFKNIIIKSDPANKIPPSITPFRDILIENVKLDPSSIDDNGFFVDSINEGHCLVYRSKPADSVSILLDKTKNDYIIKLYKGALKCFFGFNFRYDKINALIMEYNNFKPLKFKLVNVTLFDGFE